LRYLHLAAAHVQGQEGGRAERRGLHKLYNDGQLAEIYSTGHSKFKGATTEKQFLEFLGAVQRKAR